jgi:hypothetical protein
MLLFLIMVSISNIPNLTEANLDDARLFANRFDLISSLKDQIGQNANISEVGVALGEFSTFLLENLQPELFIAIDTFQMHLQDEIWGKPSRYYFGDSNHEEYYRKAVAKFVDKVSIFNGLSFEGLHLMPSDSMDLIYLDANHDYDFIKEEIAIAVSKIKIGGFIILNDYTTYDKFIMRDYGVVLATNEFLTNNQNFKVCAFALEPNMFCDIALVRIGE